MWARTVAGGLGNKHEQGTVMAGPAVEQRLAAILAADVAGYSRLMQDDERATLADLDDCRAVFRARIAAAGGRVVDTAGDSVLAVFALATRAVQAALTIQLDLAARNDPLLEGRRMRFRIGIHLGEVLQKHDGTVYGDGVNIAARLEGLAEPGGVCVSANVHEVAAGKLKARFADAGEHQVKNIEWPVHAWNVAPDGDDGGDDDDAPSTPAKPAPITDRPSIVVLPFDNMSGDPEQEYFSDGISEDVITGLSKVPGLFVIARNSAFVYKGKAHNLPDVAAALGVRYVLEGSVRKAGNRVRITAQLIDGVSGGHLWADRYDRELEDIFAVQDEVTEAIVDQLSLRLGPDDEDRVSRPRTTNMAAWDLFLRGREAAWTLTRGASLEASRMLEEVVSLDRDLAVAHAMLGFMRASQAVNGWTEKGGADLADGIASAETAIRLDPKEALAHFAHALGLQYAGRLEEATAAAERAIALDANLCHAHGVMGSSVLFIGKPEAALHHLDIAMRLDPYFPNVLLHLCALAHYMLGDYQSSRALLEQRMALKVETDSTPFVLASCHGRLGDRQAAARAWRQVFETNADFSVTQRRRSASYRDIRHFDDIVEGLRLAGIDPDTAPG